MNVIINPRLSTKTYFFYMLFANVYAVLIILFQFWIPIQIFLFGNIEVTEATVKSAKHLSHYNPDGSSYYWEIEYEYFIDESKFEGKTEDLRRFTRYYEVGDKIKIYYYKDLPEKSDLYKRFSIFLVFFAIMISWSSIISFVKRKNYYKI